MVAKKLLGVAKDQTTKRLFIYWQNNGMFNRRIEEVLKTKHEVYEVFGFYASEDNSFGFIPLVSIYLYTAR